MHKILRAIVIDDDKETVEIFCEYLKLVDVDVVGWGYNGKNAVELYEEYRPDVIFVDLVMPDYDGFLALKNIKNIDPNAKVVIITGNYNDDVAKKLERLKPYKIMQKPFETEQILEIIVEIRQSMKVTV